MALTIGTFAASVDQTLGTISTEGSGMSKRVGDAGIADIESANPLTRPLPTFPPPTPPWPQSQADWDAAVLIGAIAGRTYAAARWSALAVAIATGVCASITTDAHAIISTGTVAGRMPASTTQHTAIEGPASDVALAIV